MFWWHLPKCDYVLFVVDRYGINMIVKTIKKLLTQNFSFHNFLSTHTLGTYSSQSSFVTYAVSNCVFPTTLSPTTIIFIGFIFQLLFNFLKISPERVRVYFLLKRCIRNEKYLLSHNIILWVCLTNF